VKVRKEVIRTGDHTYLDENGRPAVLKTTKDKIDHYFRSGSDMIAAGIPIPVPLEHQPSATPMNAMDRAADLLRNNAGEIHKFETDTIKDKEGNDVHRLMSVIDFKDDSIGKKVQDGSIRWVSPWINSFVDGKGKEWNEVISHVALTSRPRIHEQQPFENVAMAFSQVLMPGSKLKKSGIELPSAGRLKRKDKKLVPEFPVAFNLLSAKFGDDFKKKIEKEEEDDTEDAEDEDTMGDGDTGDGDSAGDSAGDPLATEMAGDDVMGNSAGDVSFEELIPHLLEMHGIHVPAGGKGKEFLKALVQGLLVSAKTMAATDGGADDSVLGDPAVDAADPMAAKKGPIVQESPPMYMSITADEVKKIKDPKERQTAEAFLSLRQQRDADNAVAAALQKNLLDDAKAVRQTRIDRIASKLPAGARDKFLAEMNKPNAQLSLTKSGTNIGKIYDPMDVMLETFEQSIPDLPAMLKTGVKLSEQEHPADGTMTDARAEEIANQQMSRMNTFKAPSSTDALLSVLTKAMADAARK